MTGISPVVLGHQRWIGRALAGFDAASLGPDEFELAARRLAAPELLPVGRELVVDGGVQARIGMILSGWACRQRLLPDGRRQILDLLSVGDCIGLFEGGPLAEAETVCLTRVEFADAEALHRDMGARPEAYPVLRRALAEMAREEQGRLLDQIVRLGRHTAHERAGHLLLDLYHRARAAGCASDGRFPLPLTQEVLADALGLSVVHVNRVLQQLKRERLLELHGGRAHLLDIPSLARLCDFVLPGHDAAPGLN